MKSKSHQTAENNGRKAREDGLPKTACPYKRNDLAGKNHNCITGARGYWRAWMRGYTGEEMSR